MNTTRNLLLAALLANGGHAMAASSVDLAVKGKITPSACTPAISNGGVHDIGKVSVKDLNIDKYTPLATHTLQFTVTCEAATLVAVESKDNRAGSEFMNQPSYFGLGLINGTEKLGSLAMDLRSLTADGVASRGIQSRNGGLNWLPGSPLGPDRITSVAQNNTLVPIPVQLLVADLELRPIIAPANTLTLTDEVPIDGSATLTVKYL